MSQISVSTWKSIFREHFRKLEETGGTGYLKVGDVLMTNKLSENFTSPEDLETLDQAVNEYVNEGYLKKEDSSHSQLGFDLAITERGISAFL